jgi:hypothetical protein
LPGPASHRVGGLRRATQVQCRLKEKFRWITTKMEMLRMDPFGLGTIVWLAAVVFGLILAVAWIVLPFALIGTKPLLRQLIAEVRRTNALLEQRRTP